MKKILFALFGVLLIGLSTSTAFADHYGIPAVGQVRTEVVWICKNIDDARAYVTLRADIAAKAEEGHYFIWIVMLREIVGQGRCIMREVEYVVDEVVEIVSGLEVTNRAFGEPIPHYIIKYNEHFVVTY